MKNAFRITSGIVIGLALVVLAHIVLFRDSLGTLAFDVVRYFIYFTTWSNIGVAIYFIGKAINLKGDFFNSKIVKMTLLTCICLTSIIYMCFLFNVETNFITAFANYILHLGSAILFLIEYIFNTPKGTLKYADVLDMSKIFIIYIPFILCLGKIINWYPYAFVDVNTLGYRLAFRNGLYVIIGYVIFAATIVTMDKLLYKVRIDKFKK